MNWINLGLGAVIGAISGTLAAMLARKFTSKRYVYVIVFFLSFTLFSLLSKQFLSPVIHAWRSERRSNDPCLKSPPFNISLNTILRSTRE